MNMLHNMSEPVFVCKVAALREKLRLSQVELARRAGLTRQAVNTIERGLSVPSVVTAIRLAEALGCPVTELFQQSLSEQIITATLADTADFSQKRVRLIEVSGRWIAIPSPSLHQDFFGEADGHLISRNGQQGQIKLLGNNLEPMRNNLLVAGCDPALGILRELWNQNYGGGVICWRNLASSAAVQALRQGEAHVAGVHFHDPQQFSAAIASLSADVIVVRFACWEQGWMVPRGNPFHFQSVEDLASETIHLINRNQGSGSRLLLDALLEEVGMIPSAISHYDQTAPSHFACAQAIREGKANVAVGLRAVADAADLDFLPIQLVNFDLIIPKSMVDFPPVARMLDLLQNHKFSRQLADLPGYETSNTGKVVLKVQNSQS